MLFCPKCQRPLQEPIPRFCNSCGQDLTPLQAMAQAAAQKPASQAPAQQEYAPNQKPLNPTPRPEDRDRTPPQTTPLPISAEPEAPAPDRPGTPAVPVQARSPRRRNPLLIVFAAVLVVSLLGALVFGAVSLLKGRSGGGDKEDSALSSGEAAPAPAQENEAPSGSDSQAMPKPPAPGIHTYELVQGTCTWHEAQRAAAEKGGHLVCFETREEYEHVLGLLQQDATLFYCRIGARRDLDSTEYRWVDQADATFGEVLNSEAAWCRDCWREGEPNITWKDTIEAYVVLRFNWDTNAWDWIDIPDEVSDGLKPEIVGYIVEYEPAD